MLTEGREAELLEKAEVEEKVCNWLKAAILHERIAKSYFENKMIEEAAESFYEINIKN